MALVLEGKSTGSDEKTVWKGEHLIWRTKNQGRDQGIVQLKDSICFKSVQGIIQLKDSICFKSVQGIIQLKDSICFKSVQGIIQLKDSICFKSVQIGSLEIGPWILV